MAHIINSGPSVFGWQCPVCLHVLSPKVEECPHCPAEPAEPVAMTFTGSVDPKALARVMRHEIHRYNIRNGGSNA